MLAGAVLILLGVMSLALYAFWPRRRWQGSSQLFLVGGGLIFPAVTLAALLAYALMRGEQLSGRAPEGTLVVNAHAEQWLWTFSYPNGQLTQNILHVPAGEPFQLAITSADVIHSFWVPQLGGKMDAIPGKTNRLVLQADRPGIYRGKCAEYCGIGHLEMQFELHAHRPEVYSTIIATAHSGDVNPDGVIPRDPPASRIIGDSMRRIFNQEEDD